MSRRAWVYVWFIIITGTLIGRVAFPLPELSLAGWMTFVILTLLATMTQLLEAHLNRQSYYPHLVFFFAGMLLLPPPYYVLLIVIPHLVEWVKKRFSNSPYLRPWYIQPFNISMHIIAGSTARWVYAFLDHQITLRTDTVTHFTLLSVLSVMVAAITYLILNHLIIGEVLAVARGIPWKESGVLDPENLMTDLVLLLLGYIVAVLWELNPWLILPALSPLVLIYRALMVPQLKQEARIDAKTGLWNARHFTTLIEKEMERARRFERPMAVIMADLDLLRNINNTYGHLAGDIVLGGIGQIIRETIRDYDIAGRFGGEEFAICLPETEMQEARWIAERIRIAIEKASFEVSTSPTPIGATMSLGVACFPHDATHLKDLIHEADVAVYQAKLQGRNQVVMAAEVPHFIKLDTETPVDRLEAPYIAAFTPRPRIKDDKAEEPPEEAPATAASSSRESPKPHATSAPSSGVAETQPHQRKATPEPPLKTSKQWLYWFVGVVVSAGVALAGTGFAFSPAPDLKVVLLLVVLGILTEWTQVELYGDGSVSVSLAINFAAGLLAGLPGVAIVSVAIVLTHHLRMRPEPYKTLFNWAVHMLAGAMPALLATQLPVPLQVGHLPKWILIGGIAGLAYYMVETVLIAGAVGLSRGRRLTLIWQEQYRWLAYHYLVLCTLGMFLAVIYPLLGMLGAVAFVLPMFMIRFAQQQYIERTEDSVRELKRLNWELTQANQEIVTASQAIRRLNDELFLTLSKIIDARDPYVSGHASQVANYATAVAQALGLPAERVELVRQAAFLHDIGKIGIAESILHKPEALTDEEYEHIKMHVILGAEFLETSQGLRPLASLTRHHHEWWNGQGYPDGLAGEDIPLEARIIAVCDAVEAMASDRPYHRAMPIHEIIAELRRCAGTQFDPDVVEAFIQVVEREGEQLVINSARSVVQKQQRNGSPVQPNHAPPVE